MKLKYTLKTFYTMYIVQCIHVCVDKTYMYVYKGELINLGDHKHIGKYKVLTI